jgi:hypothetical protein
MTTWVYVPSQGKSTFGKGTFSAKLDPAAALVALAYQTVTGVPLVEIAKGGRYALRENFGNNGLQTGTMVLKFKEAALGTACANFSAHHVGSVTSGGYVKDIGTLQSTGGSGPASKWHSQVSFALTGVGGTSVEKLSWTGKATASLGSARKPSASCKAVLKLL